MTPQLLNVIITTIFPLYILIATARITSQAATINAQNKEIRFLRKQLRVDSQQGGAILADHDGKSEVLTIRLKKTKASSKEKS